MSDNSEKANNSSALTPEELKAQLDAYMQERDAARLDAQLAAEEAQLLADEAAMAEEVENAELEQAQVRTSEELKAYREQLWGAAIAATAAADAERAADAGITTVQTQTGSTLQVLPGGAAPTAAPASPVDVGASIPGAQLPPPPVVPAPAAVDPAYVRSYPPVVAPRSLFDLKLRPDMYPQESFFTHYLAVMEPTTDAPQSFHLATAISILATAMGPTWTLKHQSGGLRVNVWFMLLADSGTRKSTAMKVARSMFSETVCWEGLVESTVAWFQSMYNCQDANVLWIFDEAISFFSMLTKTHTKDIGDRLTSAYNGETLTYQTKASVIKVERPYLSILTGTPIHSLRQRGISQEVLQGGIFGRFLLIPGTATRALALPPAVDAASFAALQNIIDTVYKQRRQVQVTLSYEAEQTYRAWYEGRGNGGILAETSTGIWNRAGDHVLKLALIYHTAAYRRADMPIQKDTMEQAITFLQEYLLPGHLWATRRFMETSPVKQAFMAVEDYAENTEGVLYSSLPDLLGVTLDYLAKILAVLWHNERIEFWSWRPNPGEICGGNPKILLTRKGRKPTCTGEVYELQIEVPRAVRKYLKLVGEDKELQSYQDEFNVCGTWNPLDDE